MSKAPSADTQLLRDPVATTANVCPCCSRVVPSSGPGSGVRHRRLPLGIRRQPLARVLTRRLRLEPRDVRDGITPGRLTA